MKRKKFSLPPEARGIMGGQSDEGDSDSFPDRIVISRGGLAAFGTHGFRGDKEIPLESITSVQVFTGGRDGGGYIQFGVIGGIESVGSAWAATRDENTVLFQGGAQAAEFQRAKERIDEYRRLLSTPRQAKPRPSGRVSELERLARLREDGMLSDDEYRAAKEQVLGLD